MTEKLSLPEMVRLNIGISEKELDELLNGDYEIADSSDEELMLELWEEAANRPPRARNELDYDYDDPDFWVEENEEPDFWLVEEES